MEASSCNHQLASLLIVLSIMISSINFCQAAGRAYQEADTRFIRTSCSSTSYPKLCFTSLASHASFIQSNHQLLAGTALNVTLLSVKSTTMMMSMLSKSYGLTPREVSAMRDCVEELSDSVDELNKSIAEMEHLNRSNFELTKNDIQTWVSAALTDESTCTDGFGGKAMNGKVKTAVRERIVNVAQLTSNALALVNQLASLHN